MSLEHDLETHVADALGGSVTVEEVTVTPAGRRRVVRVTVDRPLPGAEGSDPVPPLSLDEVSEATRAVSEVLDGTDLLGQQPYTLEVTTPGIGRPLTTPEHFRRNVSRMVEVERLDGDAPVTGRVVRVTADRVELETRAERKKPATVVEIPFAEVRRGTVQVEFNRTDEEGR
ncbi:ribosome maturation factor RimP [Marihabitans asiaticum]|uniref:Ribosome maturation factor RimP n=1 Tax=Marihabitans asiaticum TaxID=415218 RepID=A0A560W9U2_9MICO|nr:ribosome maturation factor RimP [Marihabitans asiaticum]TWD14397.1 ribosome maturation factor RimP [Marihabitans asiaticum]